MSDSAPIGVENAVEEMLGGKPTAEKAGKDAPQTETPAKDAPDEGAKTRGDSGEGSESAEYTAFEQELIAELDQEDKTAFEEGSPEYRKQALAFMKKQYRRSAKQMTELGTLRKAVGALRDAGVTNEDLVKLVQQKRGGTKAEAQEVVNDATKGNGNGSKRGYQRWHESAKSSEEREQLREAEQVQRELIEDVVKEYLGKEIRPIKDRLESSDRERLTERAQSLEADINVLEDDLGYPGSLVETYRDAMVQEGLKHPKLDAEELLVRVAGFKTVKAAMLKMQGTKEAAEETPAKPSAPVMKKTAPVNGQELPRKRSGNISIHHALDLLMKPKR